MIYGTMTTAQRMKTRNDVYVTESSKDLDGSGALMQKESLSFS